MGTQRFNVLGEEQQRKIKMFRETMKRIDKDAIIQAFLLGLDIGYFKYKDRKTGKVIQCHPNNNLFFKFEDGRGYVYLLTRMPASKLNINPNSPIAHAIINKDKQGGLKF